MFNDPIWTVLSVHTQDLVARLKKAREEDRGAVSIETMIIVGALVAGAVIAAAFLVAKVNEKKDAIK
ncbi:hypothetical protein ACFY1P_20095 [Streptomyces sp. NPDC001407]|uniref:hypothetical protein n=1 Tax=Streptomyces sp. NPDC001407 TaxID=3364573 RepID=UPI0036A43ED7